METKVKCKHFSQHMSTTLLYIVLSKTLFSRLQLHYHHHSKFTREHTKLLHIHTLKMYKHDITHHMYINFFKANLDFRRPSARQPTSRISLSSSLSIRTMWLIVSKSSALTRAREMAAAALVLYSGSESRSLKPSTTPGLQNLSGKTDEINDRRHPIT